MICSWSFPKLRQKHLAEYCSKYAVPKELNGIPYHIRNCDNIELFKKHLKTFNSNQAFN
jgi:hypothetical protein